MSTGFASRSVSQMAGLSFCGCASVVGRAHRLMGRGNQDACVAFTHEDLSIAVVSDGCSSGRHSELGAGVGARAVAAAAARRAGEGAPLDALPPLVLADWTEELARIVRATTVTSSFAEGVNDAWLATLLVVVARAERAIVFGVGDGVVFIDGRVLRLDEGDAPDYPAYALFPHMRAPRLRVHHEGAFSQIAVATDGALGFEADVLALLDVPRLRGNPSLLQKKLNVLRDRALPPEDDCTIGVVARGPSLGVTPCA